MAFFDDGVEVRELAQGAEVDVSILMGSLVELFPEPTQDFWTLQDVADSRNESPACGVDTGIDKCEHLVGEVVQGRRLPAGILPVGNEQLDDRGISFIAFVEGFWRGVEVSPRVVLADLSLSVSTSAGSAYLFETGNSRWSQTV